MNTVSDQEFYEDDERAGDVFAAFEAGEKLRTQPPARGQTKSFYLEGTRPGEALVTTARAVVHGERLPVGSNS
jgi:hypothetical protein